jgi:hypothetical protein
VDDDTVQTFCAITGAAPDVAAKWIRRYGSAEAATQQYFTLGELPPDQSQSVAGLRRPGGVKGFV